MATNAPMYLKILRKIGWINLSLGYRLLVDIHRRNNWRLLVSAGFSDFNVPDALLHLEVSKIFFCVAELWKQTMTFAIKQSCSFLLFMLFWEFHACKNIYIIDRNAFWLKRILCYVKNLKNKILKKAALKASYTYSCCFLVHKHVARYRLVGASAKCKDSWLVVFILIPTKQLSLRSKLVWTF